MTDNLITSRSTPRVPRAFRVVTILTLLWTVALLLFGLAEAVLMWLPTSTVSELPDFDPRYLDHRLHLNTLGLTAWILVISLAVQLRRPGRHVAEMLLAVGLTVTAAAAYALDGPVTNWLATDLTVLVPVLLVAALHPALRPLPPLRVHRVGLGLAALAAVPWLGYAGVHVSRQLDPPAGFARDLVPEAWASMVVFAVTLTLAALLGATRMPGAAVAGWAAVVGTADVALHSLAFGAASALSAPWAVAALAWCVAYAVARERRRRDLGESAPRASHAS